MADATGLEDFPGYTNTTKVPPPPHTHVDIHVHVAKTLQMASGLKNYTATTLQQALESIHVHSCLQGVWVWNLPCHMLEARWPNAILSSNRGNHVLPEA